MAANDYLNQKSIELFPVSQRQENYYSVLPQRKRYRKTRPTTKLTKRRSNTLNSTNAILSQRTRQNKIIYSQFKVLNSTGKLISGTLGLLTKNHQLLLVGVLGIGAAIFSVSKYLDNTESSFSPEYAPGYSGMSTGKTSEQGIYDMLQYESFRAEAYQDSGGIWTIGYGHTKNVKPGDVVTKEQAIELFKQDLQVAENSVNKNVKVPISQNMFDTLVDFAFNVGTGAFESSTLLKKLNAGDYQGAANEFKNWIYDNKKQIQKGLVTRNEKRAQKFLADVSEDNKLITAPVNISADQVIRTTSAGKINRLANNTRVGGYKMTNPSKVRNYIDLSDRAIAYLQETGGQGIVTSGAEGSHASGKLSHASGNKIDVQGLKGAATNNKEYAELCARFLKNPNTAYINLETFTEQDVNDVLNYLKQIDPPAYKLAFQYTPYSPGECWFGKNKLLCAIYIPKNPKHLDIGIKPDAYSEKNHYNTGQFANKPKDLNKEIPKKDNTKTTNIQQKTNKTNKTKPSGSINIKNSSNEQKTGINLSTYNTQRKNKKD